MRRPASLRSRFPPPGAGLAFTAGGYCGAGMGAMPFGVWDVTPAKLHASLSHDDVKQQQGESVTAFLLHPAYASHCPQGHPVHAAAAPASRMAATSGQTARHCRAAAARRTHPAGVWCSFARYARHARHARCTPLRLPPADAQGEASPKSLAGADFDAQADQALAPQ